MRLTRRKLIVAGILVAMLAAVPWVVVIVARSGRDKARAMYERLQPGMTVAQVQDVIRSEEIQRADISAERAYWSMDGKYEFVVSFDATGKMDQKILCQTNMPDWPDLLKRWSWHCGLDIYPELRRWP